MDTVSEIIDMLRKEGYVEDFNLQQTCLECREGHFKVFHDEFVIDNIYIVLKVIVTRQMKQLCMPFLPQSMGLKACW